MTNFEEPKIVPIRTIIDERGCLGFVEAQDDAGFLFRRLYFLYGVTEDAARGAHAHKALRQFMIAMHGAFTITLQGKGKEYVFHLKNQQEGLLIPPGYWRDLSGFTNDAVCLVAASEKYSEDDYIRNYDDFIAWEGRHS